MLDTEKKYGRVTHCSDLDKAEEISSQWIGDRVKIGDSRFKVTFIKNPHGGYTLEEEIAIV